MIPTVFQVLTHLDRGNLVYALVEIGQNRRVVVELNSTSLKNVLGELDLESRLPRAKRDKDGDIYFGG